MNNQQILKGQCLCGKVAFELTSNDLKLYQCHCSLCRRVSGSSSNSATLVSASDFNWLQGTDDISYFKTDSGFRSDFCKSCGSPVPNSIDDGDGYWIPVGLMDTDNNISVIAHVYTDSKSAWHMIGGDAPRYSSMPSNPTLKELVQESGHASDQESKFQIRQFVETDRKPLITLWEQCGLVVPRNNPSKDIDRKLQKDADLLLVGTIGDSLVATVMGGYDGHRGWINYLAVDPNHRRGRLAEQLMLAVEDRLRELGCAKINLQIRRSNTPVMSFYEAIDYREDDVVSYGKRLEPDL
jgi:ribosomal protein S18 acetylase RimI-like enzyme